MNGFKDLWSGLTGGILLLVLIGLTWVTVAFHENIAGLLAAAGDSIQGAPDMTYFIPYDASDTLSVGSTTNIDLDIRSRVPINAVGATIVFPKDKLDVVGISKANSFLDLWTEDTSINEDNGSVHFSGGTTAPGGMTGTSTIITITVKAKAPGDATLSVGSLDVFAADGQGTSLATDSRPFVVSISEVPTTTAAATQASGSGGAPAAAPKPPSPDLNGDGTVNLIDVSIMVVHMVLPYDPRFDLNLDGRIDLGDLSVLVSKMGKLQN